MDDSVPFPTYSPKKLTPFEVAALLFLVEIVDFNCWQTARVY